jgi:hypothetical protein
MKALYDFSLLKSVFQTLLLPIAAKEKVLSYRKLFLDKNLN